MSSMCRKVMTFGVASICVLAVGGCSGATPSANSTGVAVGGAGAIANDSTEANGFQSNCYTDNGALYVVLTIQNNTGGDLNEDYQSASEAPFNYNAWLPSGGPGAINACMLQMDPPDVDGGSTTYNKGQYIDIQYVDWQRNAYNIHLEQTQSTPYDCNKSSTCQDPSWDSANISATWAFNTMPTSKTTPVSLTVDFEHNSPTTPANLTINLTPG